jgi:hypothetical protein
MMTGQYILRKLLLLLRKVTTLGIEVDLRWILAHKGVPGNEAADLVGIEVDLRWILAHKGVPGTGPRWVAPQGSQDQDQDQNRRRDHDRDRDRDQERRGSRGIQTLLTTAKRVINEALQDDWETIWKHGKHGRYLHSLDTGPDKKALKMHQNLPRAISSIITQMRTGKIGLPVYLHSINRADTSQCTCRRGDQTVEHILPKCREWAAE